MTILDAPPCVALDESAHEFISGFMTHVATVSGYGANCSATTARIKTLLLGALARGDGAFSNGWSTLHHAITELVAAADATTDRAYDTRAARDYLQSFIRENADLADPLERDVVRGHA